MYHEVPEANPPLTREQEAAIRALAADDLTTIDEAILGSVSNDWQKTAMVCIRIEERLRTRFPIFTFSVYALRLEFLVDRGNLESRGDLDYLRFSEVRLAKRS